METRENFHFFPEWTESDQLLDDQDEISIDMDIRGCRHFFTIELLQCLLLVLCLERLELI
jgi:hypothetical protein